MTSLRKTPLSHAHHGLNARMVDFAGWSMPVQYYRIRSEGDSGVGDEVKVVEVTRTLSSAPGIMDYVLYSGGSLVK